VEDTAILLEFFLTDYSLFCIFNPSRSKFLSSHLKITSEMIMNSRQDLFTKTLYMNAKIETPPTPAHSVYNFL
jgi:hypothetical protein